MLGALGAGVPMLAVPQGADQFYNAERIVDAGLGLRLLPDELTAENVRDRASRLLEDERYARAASAQRFEIEAMPGPEAVVARLLKEAEGSAAA
jgi:UDP:flavonoid glycosyltransferase YjiC (YdhE family)